MTNTKYPVITLCGSTKYKAEFEQEQKRLTLSGQIVISVGLFGHSGDKEVWEGEPENVASQTKTMLDDMHKRKIEMADSIYVINPGGYIGKSTESEICFASMIGKKIDAMEEISSAFVEDMVGKHILTAQERAWLNLQDYLYGSEGMASVSGLPVSELPARENTGSLDARGSGVRRGVPARAYEGCYGAVWNIRKAENGILC